MNYLQAAFEALLRGEEYYQDGQGRVFRLVNAANETGDRSQRGKLVMREERSGCQPRNHWGFVVYR
jgi:hypothetical protein